MLIRSCCPMHTVSLRCRSESLSQALLDSLTDIDPDSIQRSTSVVLDFLDDLRALAMFTQRFGKKDKASESVRELAKVPGMLQSSTLAYSTWEAAVLWLVSVVSDTSTPGRSTPSPTKRCALGAVQGWV